MVSSIRFSAQVADIHLHNENDLASALSQKDKFRLDQIRHPHDHRNHHHHCYYHYHRRHHAATDRWSNPDTSTFRSSTLHPHFTSSRLISSHLISPPAITATEKNCSPHCTSHPMHPQQEPDSSSSGADVSNRDEDRHICLWLKIHCPMTWCITCRTSSELV